MKMKITSETEDGRKVFRVGDLPFDTAAEAEEFLEWLDWLMRRIKARSSDAEMWAGQRQASSDIPAIHDIATSLAYLSFVLAGMGVVDQMHLAMSRRILATLETAVQRQQAEGKDFAEKMQRMRAARQPKHEPQKKKKNPAPGM